MNLIKLFYFELCLWPTTALVELYAASVSQFPCPSCLRQIAVLIVLWPLQRKSFLLVIRSHSDVNFSFLMLHVCLWICTRGIWFRISRTHCLPLSCDGTGMQQCSFSHCLSCRSQSCVCMEAFQRCAPLVQISNCLAAKAGPPSGCYTQPSSALSYRSSFTLWQSVFCNVIKIIIIPCPDNFSYL